MPYDGSGNFTIINNFEEDRINGVSIDSLKMDNNFEDIANGLSNAMLRSGSAVMTGILNMGDHKITNLVAGTSSNDAVNKGQMDTALSAKQATITGGASTITSSNLTANRALVSNSSGKVAVSAVTSTELGYLSGVTSAIQTQLNNKQATITGAATTITGSNLAFNCAVVSSSTGKVTSSSTTSTEIGYVHGVTSAIQTQINGKQATITGGASTITSSNLTTNRALVSNSSGKVAVSAVTATELGYLDGVTSAIQTQLNNKITATFVNAVSGSWKDNKNNFLINRGRDKLTTSVFKITFPEPFKSTNYSFVGIATEDKNSGYSYDAINGVTDRQKTYIKIYSYYGNQNIDWIAIGY